MNAPRALALAPALLAGHACLADPLPPESFESGFNGWVMDSAVEGSLPFNPVISRTPANAHSGQWSARFSARGDNDDGVLWLERSLLLPAGTFDCSVTFWMWSPAQADFGTWDVVASIGPENPETESDFTVIGPTHIAAGWVPYTFTRRITNATSPEIWFAFGFSITFEVDGEFDFDDVVINVSPRPFCPADFNADGNLDPDDLADFINCYFALPPCERADFNQDGEVNADDLGDFVNAYFAGCP